MSYLRSPFFGAYECTPGCLIQAFAFQCYRIKFMLWQNEFLTWTKFVRLPVGSFLKGTGISMEQTVFMGMGMVKSSLYIAYNKFNMIAS